MLHELERAQGGRSRTHVPITEQVGLFSTRYGLMVMISSSLFASHYESEILPSSPNPFIECYSGHSFPSSDQALCQF